MHYIFAVRVILSACVCARARVCVCVREVVARKQMLYSREFINYS